VQMMWASRRSHDLNMGVCKSRTIMCVKILHNKGIHSTKINICIAIQKGRKNKEKLISPKPLTLTDQSISLARKRINKTSS